ncbi:MAG: rod shape-determining protein RodA, partial [Caulobacterales bacterium]|nr:rod shape-determining protein RodA [Caulobacterales bacterium]
MAQAIGFAPPRSARFGLLGWLLLLLIGALGAFGVAMLYSVAGDPASYTASTSWWERGEWTPWASRHATRLAAGMAILVALGFVPIQWWRATAYPIYLGALILLLGVEFAGEIGMGAKRWIVLGPLRLQPSELMKLALVLALARYYHDTEHRHLASLATHVPPLIMLALPVALIVRQPDLGTALLVAATGSALVFMAGVPWRMIGAAASLGSVALVLLFSYGLHDYQRGRIMAFLNPGADPMGAGYHSLQSKIAIGSGGLGGKGFGAGTQTQLGFLPEKHTDFIFTVIGEELGFFGGLALLTLVAAIVGLTMFVAANSRHQFGRLAAMGVAVTFALYAI